MQRLAVEEEAAVARMVEKHSQEMLRLISDKVSRGAIAKVLLDVKYYSVTVAEMILISTRRWTLYNSIQYSSMA